MYVQTVPTSDAEKLNRAFILMEILVNLIILIIQIMIKEVPENFVSDSLEEIKNMIF
jgi:hypothetical protein